MAKAYLARDCGGEQGVIAALQATPKAGAMAVGDRGQTPAPLGMFRRPIFSKWSWLFHCQDWQLSFDATSLEVTVIVCTLKVCCFFSFFSICFAWSWSFGWRLATTTACVGNNTRCVDHQWQKPWRQPAVMMETSPMSLGRRSHNLYGLSQHKICSIHDMLKSSQVQRALA